MRLRRSVFEPLQSRVFTVRLAIKVVADAYDQQNDWTDPLSLAEIWADHAHQAVSQQFNQEGLSSLVLAIVSGRDFWGAYVGDSLCLLAPQKEETVCLTEPHQRSVLRMLNGKPVLRDGMPIFDKGLIQALGQPAHCIQTVSPRIYLRPSWLACFTDGVDEHLLDNFLRNGAINAVTVEAFVAESARHTNDDATLVLFQSAPDTDRLRLADRMANYAKFDSDTRDRLLGQFDRTLLAGHYADILAAYRTEDDGRRASQLARLLLTSGELEHQTAVGMLTEAVLRRQSETCQELKRAVWLFGAE